MNIPYNVIIPSLIFLLGQHLTFIHDMVDITYIEVNLKCYQRDVSCSLFLMLGLRQYILMLLWKLQVTIFEPSPGLILISAFICFSDVLAMHSFFLLHIDLHSFEFSQPYSLFCFDNHFYVCCFQHWLIVLLYIPSPSYFLLSLCTSHN